MKRTDSNLATFAHLGGVKPFVPTDQGQNQKPPIAPKRVQNTPDPVSMIVTAHPPAPALEPVPYIPFPIMPVPKPTVPLVTSLNRGDSRSVLSGSSSNLSVSTGTDDGSVFQNLVGDEISAASNVSPLGMGTVKKAHHNHAPVESIVPSLLTIVDNFQKVLADIRGEKPVKVKKQLPAFIEWINKNLNYMHETSKNGSQLGPIVLFQAEQNLRIVLKDLPGLLEKETHLNAKQVKNLLKDIQDNWNDSVQWMLNHLNKKDTQTLPSEAPQIEMEKIIAMELSNEKKPQIEMEKITATEPKTSPVQNFVEVFNESRTKIQKFTFKLSKDSRLLESMKSDASTYKFHLDGVTKTLGLELVHILEEQAGLNSDKALALTAQVLAKFLEPITNAPILLFHGISLADPKGTKVPRLTVAILEKGIQKATKHNER
jgi:hypothetical protein